MDVYQRSQSCKLPFRTNLITLHVRTGMHLRLSPQINKSSLGRQILRLGIRKQRRSESNY